MACEKIFLKQLREHGFRLTPQREMVLEVLHQVDGTPTADEIYAQVQEKSSCVDISTVYRTLELLAEFRLVACIDAGDGQHHYALLGAHGPHFHLACQGCGALIGVDAQEAQYLIDHLRAAYGFEADLTQMTVPGLCEECRSAVQEPAAREAELS